MDEASPDLILLNHRLKLGKGLPHATTFLWGGAETYIDVRKQQFVAERLETADKLFDRIEELDSQVAAATGQSNSKPT